MSQLYRTSDGDMLDWICYQHYGRTAGAVEAVLVANPGLSARGPVLSAGVLLVLPVLPPQENTVVRLWD
ncbi:tail protein X [Chrysiogenes arsenatis]|uniref:tail protein X n=1 Tax=Chrysiogenes arsenatis TaxID=309797 RepID=UPI00040CE673|nr:tail protein X [Chrysiogenes arsenatis]